MADLQAAKAAVLSLDAALDQADEANVGSVLERHVAPDYHWRGMHPFHEQRGAGDVANSFWAPLKRAIGPWQRRPDMFLAGMNQLDDGASLWVAEMGHLMGMWDAPWLGIAPSRKLSFLRYAEFHRVQDGRIAETASYFDVLNFLSLAGHATVPSVTGIETLSPGPRTHDGLLHAPQDPVEGKTTVDLISAMVTDLRANTVQSPGDHIARFWTPDMCWFGPGGIGASGFFDGYRRGHAWRAGSWAHPQSARQLVRQARSSAK